MAGGVGVVPGSFGYWGVLVVVGGLRWCVVWCVVGHVGGVAGVALVCVVWLLALGGWVGVGRVGFTMCAV